MVVGLVVTTTTPVLTVVTRKNLGLGAHRNVHDSDSGRLRRVDRVGSRRPR